MIVLIRAMNDRRTGNAPAGGAPDPDASSSLASCSLPRRRRRGTPNCSSAPRPTGLAASFRPAARPSPRAGARRGAGHGARLAPDPSERSRAATHLTRRTRTPRAGTLLSHHGSSDRLRCALPQCDEIVLLGRPCRAASMALVRPASSLALR
jgi:hypothetical protein